METQQGFIQGLFLLEGGGSLASMKHVNVQGSLVASSPEKRFWEFSFSEVDFNAILICIYSNVIKA